jgi:uncharacterized protein YggL (DUF469 family)
LKELLIVEDGVAFTRLFMEFCKKEMCSCEIQDKKRVKKWVRQQDERQSDELKIQNSYVCDEVG